MRIPLRRALAGAATVLLLASCSSSRAASPGGSRLAMIGDSLAVLGDAQILEQLEQGGWKPTIDAFAGVTTEEQMPVIAKAARDGADVFVVELGTNDGHQLLLEAISADDERGQIAKALGLVGVHCIVWVNVDANPKRPGGAAGAVVNKMLADEAAQRDNLHIADLDAVLEAHPEYFDVDDVHLTADGYAALAKLIADTVQECR